MINENIAFFKQYFPQWVQEIESAEAEYQYTILDTRNGLKTLQIDNNGESFFFHSKYDPLKEAKKLLDGSIDEDPELLIIGGFAFGYLAEQALSQYDCPVIIFDKDFYILKLAAESRDLRPLLSNSKLHTVFSDNPQAIIEILKTFQTGNIKFIMHQPSEKLYPEYYKKLKSAIDHFQNTKEINTATLSRFQKLWTKNILKNLIDIINYDGVNSLFGKFENIPCVVVAAGPSLSKNIKYLKEIQNKAIIISVDTSFQILQKYDIDPDFVVAVDPQDINKKYFENIEKSNAILIIEPSISPKIVHNYKGRKLVLGSLFHLVQWLEGFTGKKGEIEIGGSVATAAFSLAKNFGCNPIAFVGLDLAYSNNETHMKGAYFEENWIYQWNRFENNHTRSKSFLKGFGLFDIKGSHEEKVKSDRKFTMFQKWFEGQFKKCDAKVIDATEGGALIENTEILDFKDCLNQYFIQNHDIINSISELDTKNDDALSTLTTIKNELDILLSAFKGLQNDIEKAKRLSDELYNHVLKGIKYKKSLPKRVQDIHKELDIIDGKLTQDGTVNALISITIQNIISQIDNNSTEGLNDLENSHHELKVAKHSLQLYEAMLDGIEYNINQFTKSIKRLNQYLSTNMT